MPTRVATTLVFTELPVAGPFDGHLGNFDQSREAIDLIVIHTMAGTWEGAAARFNDPSSNVSAHYGVKLDGTLIHWLEESFTGYHAGDYAINQRSIGIEHEDGGDYNGARPDVLYSESSQLVADICKFYAIPCDRDHIKKHSEVSDRPTGCPDALDIDRIVRQAQAILTSKGASTEFSDQTKIPAALLNSVDYPVSIDMEIQALRGVLGDYGRTRAQLLKSVSETQNDTKNVSNPPTPPTTPSANFLDRLRKLLGL